VAKTRRLHGRETSDSPFDTGAAAAGTPDYRLGGTVESANMRLCSNRGSEMGSVELDVKWELFSSRQQRVVLSQVVHGAYRVDSFETTTQGVFMVHGFEATLNAFFDDPAVQRVMNADPATLASAPGVDMLRLAASTHVAGRPSDHVQELQAAVVTIVGERGSGSGFYVADGYVLTDRHVTGAARFVKVRLASGREIVGEVVRQNAAGDVALLKTEAIGAPVILLRLDEPAVGADVFAIGSPLGLQLPGTVTHGVVSALREQDGVRFLQSDAAVNPGSSGGPLVDGNGQAVGIAASMVRNASGLGFFIPVRSALERLGVVVDAPSTITPP
jgi:S1-C subfamily serine protease